MLCSQYDDGRDEDKCMELIVISEVNTSDSPSLEHYSVFVRFNSCISGYHAIICFTLFTIFVVVCRCYSVTRRSIYFLRPSHLNNHIFAYQRVPQNTP